MSIQLIPLVKTALGELIWQAEDDVDDRRLSPEVFAAKDALTILNRASCGTCLYWDCGRDPIGRKERRGLCESDAFDDGRDKPITGESFLCAAWQYRP